MGVSENGGTPKIIHFNRVFHYKASILGYHHLRQHSYDGSSKVLFPLLALNRNSMRDAFCFTCKKSYTEDTSKMQ